MCEGATYPVQERAINIGGLPFELTEYNHMLLLNNFCQTPVLGLGLGVDFTVAWDNNNNNDNNDNNPHLNFMKGTVLGDKERDH